MRDNEISEIERIAYIDDQLDDHGRLHVETSLAADPSAAAQMMSDLAGRTALKISLTHRPARPSVALESLARSEPPPNAQPRTRSFEARRLAAMAAAVCAAVVLGVADDAWVRDQLTGHPDYLDDAVQSREASLVRTTMAARPESPWMLPGDIRTAIRIRLPVLPKGWRFIDVQVFPSDTGPSAQLLIDTGGNGQVSLFSSKTQGDDTFQPVVVDRFEETMAFWEIEGQSFVMIGDQSRTKLRALAVDLSDNQLL